MRLSYLRAIHSFCLSYFKKLTYSNQAYNGFYFLPLIVMTGAMQANLGPYWLYSYPD